MKDIVKAHRKVIFLSFPHEISGRPMVCNLVKLYDLTFNILKANISPRREGSMTLELCGSEENFDQGISYLKEHGIKVTNAAQRISRNEESCMHCGMCLSMCPNESLTLNLSTRNVEFDPDRCIACGLCTRVCPVRAMSVDVDDITW